MAAKFVLVLCALAGGAMSQYLGGACGCGAGGLAYEGLAGPYALGGPYGLGCGVASTGGGLPVTSTSPIAPVGVSVVSENAYEGPLSVGGNLPFLGTVALEGVLPTAGAGAVSYGCGNGAVGIAAEEGPVATGITGHAVAGPAAFGPGLAGIPYGGGLAGYPYGLNGIGCGCGAIY